MYDAQTSYVSDTCSCGGNGHTLPCAHEKLYTSDSNHTFHDTKTGSGSDKNLVYLLIIGKDRDRRSTRPTDKHTILIYWF